MRTGSATGAMHSVPVSIAVARSTAGRIAPVALSVATAAALAGRVPEAAFLTLAVVVGLPHGAFDHKVARRAFGQRHGAKWWQPLVAGYLALASTMLLAWWAIPTVALCLFLFLSVLHFGDQDASAGASCRLVRIAAHGGAPIIVSAACHPETVERLLGTMLPAHAHAVTTLLAGPIMLPWAAAVVGSLIAYATRGQADDRTAALDLILVSLLFVLAPPLIAFALYFSAIHAPRAFAAAMPAGGFSSSEMVLPFVLTMLGLALGGVIFAAGAGIPAGENAVRTAFLLLSALTVPHMWLEWRARAALADALAVRSEV
jgi:Brp/Blh family beta-carotene 15,15'-monooxygenase